MKRFVLTSPAERDIDQIKAFLKQEAGATIARRVLRDIRGAMEFLAKEPGVGHAREDLTSRPVKFWTVYSYQIVYDPETKPVRIIRVLHGMRDISEILN
jgi:plasmid stabilization system protein ParE